MSRAPFQRASRWAATGLLVCVAACGEVSSGDPDAPVGPPDVDAALADAGPPPVTVTYVEPVGTLAGYAVVFHDATGQVLSTTESDAEGRAEGQVPPGGMVTLQGGPAIVGQLVTITGVQPGEHLTIGRSYRVSTDASTQGVIDATLTTPYAAADSYDLDLGCRIYGLSGGNTTLSLATTRACPMDGKRANLFAYARSSSTGELAWSAHLGLSLPPGGLDLSLGSWSTNYRESTLTLASVPGAITSARAEVRFALDGTWHYALAQGGFGGVTAGTLPLTARMPTVVNDVLSRRVFFSASGTNQNVTLSQLVPVSAADGMIDLGNEYPPKVLSATIGDSGDVARPQGTIAASGTLAHGDASFVTFRWKSTRTWMVIGPVDPETPLRAPALPAAFASYVPSVTDQVEIVSAGVFNAVGANGYDAVRPEAYAWIQRGSDLPDPDDTAHTVLISVVAP